MAPTKRPIGRPKSPQLMRRDVFLKTRVSRAELHLLEQVATEEQTTLSDYIRRRLGLSISGYNEGQPRKAKPTHTQPAPRQPDTTPEIPPALTQVDDFTPPWAR